MPPTSCAARLQALVGEAARRSKGAASQRVSEEEASKEFGARRHASMGAERRRYATTSSGGREEAQAEDSIRMMRVGCGGFRRRLRRSASHQSHWRRRRRSVAVDAGDGLRSPRSQAGGGVLGDRGGRARLTPAAKARGSRRRASASAAAGSGGGSRAPRRGGSSSRVGEAVRAEVLNARADDVVVGERAPDARRARRKSNEEFTIHGACPPRRSGGW